MMSVVIILAKCLVEPRLVEHATMGTRPQAVLLVCFIAYLTKLTLKQLCSLLFMIKTEFGMKLGKKLTAAKFSRRKKIVATRLVDPKHHIKSLIPRISKRRLRSTSRSSA
jgi:hypothetical protein